MIPKLASRSAGESTHPCPSHQTVSLFAPNRPGCTVPELPAVELVKEETEDTRAQPPLKFFDDQCGCN